MEALYLGHSPPDIVRKKAVGVDDQQARKNNGVGTIQCSQ
jgi:hypothetical protein